MQYNSFNPNPINLTLSVHFCFAPSYSTQLDSIVPLGTKPGYVPACETPNAIAIAILRSKEVSPFFRYMVQCCRTRWKHICAQPWPRYSSSIQFNSCHSGRFVHLLDSSIVQFFYFIFTSNQMNRTSRVASVLALAMHVPSHILGLRRQSRQSLVLSVAAACVHMTHLVQGQENKCDCSRCRLHCLH